MAGELLSKAELEKRHPKIGYDSYVSWVTKTRAKRAANRANQAGRGGFGNVQSPGQLQAQANQLFPSLGYSPMSPDVMRNQAGANVNAIVDPIIKQISDQITSRSKEGTAAITGFTNTYENRLNSVDDQVRGVYNQAKDDQADVNAALTSFLSGRGNELMNSLSGDLGAMNAGPGSASLAAGVGALGQGAAGEQAALGASTLSRLIAEGAGQETYAKKLPGFGRALGLQELGAFQGGLNRQLEDATGEIRAGIPGMVQNAFDSIAGRDLQGRSLEQQRRQAMASFLQGGMDRNLQSQIAASRLYQDQLGLETQNSQFWADPDNYSPQTDGKGADGFTVQDRSSIGNDAAEFVAATLKPKLPGDPEIPFAQALQATKAYLQARGISVKESQAMALRALATAGIVPPPPHVVRTGPKQHPDEGTRGPRPKPTPQVRRDGTRLPIGRTALRPPSKPDLRG
jgi:hypothetical protein